MQRKLDVVTNQFTVQVSANTIKSWINPEFDLYFPIIWNSLKYLFYSQLLLVTQSSWYQFFTMSQNRPFKPLFFFLAQACIVRSYEGSMKFKNESQGDCLPSSRNAWERRHAWTNCLIDFAPLFKGILTSFSPQTWLVQWNKNVDTLFQQMRNDKCINHSGSDA